MAANDKVRSTERTWSAECALADAIDVPEQDQGIAAIRAKQEVAYEFTGGRVFMQKRDPYAP